MPRVSEGWNQKTIKKEPDLLVGPLNARKLASVGSSFPSLVLSFAQVLSFHVAAFLFFNESPENNKPAGVAKVIL